MSVRSTREMPLCRYFHRFFSNFWTKISVPGWWCSVSSQGDECKGTYAIEQVGCSCKDSENEPEGRSRIDCFWLLYSLLGIESCWADTSWEVPWPHVGSRSRSSSVWDSSCVSSKTSSRNSEKPFRDLITLDNYEKTSLKNPVASSLIDKANDLLDDFETETNETITSSTN